MAKFVIEPHFRLQEWVAEEKDYFRDEGLDYEFRELVRSTDGKIHDKGGKRRVPVVRGRPQGQRELRLPLDRQRRRLQRPRQAVTDVYSVAPAGIFVPADSPVKTPDDLAGVPISVGFQSGSHYSTVQALEPYLKPEQINLTYADGMLFKRMELLLEGKAPAVQPVQRSLLLRRAARLPQGDRHHLHDRHHDPRRSRSGGPAQVLPRAAQGAARHRPAPGPLHALLQERIPRPLPRDAWTRGAGDRASGWCSSPIPRRSTRSPSSGSPPTASSRTARWAAGNTSRPRCHWAKKPLLGAATTDWSPHYLIRRAANVISRRFSLRESSGILAGNKNRNIQGRNDHETYSARRAPPCSRPA